MPIQTLTPAPTLHLRLPSPRPHPMTTNGGRVSLLGLPSRPVTLDLSSAIIFRGVRVYGITGRELWRTWYKTAALLREGLDVSPIITHRLPLTRFEEAFDLLG
ncbi:MAG TPA: hypothetical protein VF375_04160 [Candidatus Limnocylindrales bacterium]